VVLRQQLQTIKEHPDVLEALRRFLRGKDKKLEVSWEVI
jgi:hypothetical protein